MFRRPTLVALLTAVLCGVFAPGPASAKGPTEVEVRRVPTGTSTTFTQPQVQLAALSETVGWPSSPQQPALVRSGALKHVATLVWRVDREVVLWVDRIYSDGEGTAYVSRRDHASGVPALRWGQLASPYTVDVLLAALEKPGANATEPAQRAGQSEAPTAADASRATTARGTDRSSFGRGAGLGALVGIALGAVALRLRRR